MPSAREVGAALYGAWRLMRFDAGGMAWFDVSITGFWRSFFAAVLVAPGFAVLLVFNLAGRGGEPVGLGKAIVVWTVAYAVIWAAFPIAAILITRLLRLGGRYIPLIIAYNWANVPQVVVNVAATLISAGAGGGEPGEPGGAGNLFALAAFIYLRVYLWFVIRAALETTALTAAAIVLFDFLIGAIIGFTASGLV
jgi:hypothetical protein